MPCGGITTWGGGLLRTRVYAARVRSACGPCPPSPVGGGDSATTGGVSCFTFRQCHPSSSDETANLVSLNNIRKLPSQKRANGLVWGGITPIKYTRALSRICIPTPSLRKARPQRAKRHCAHSL
eukprot:gene17898-biopygen23383